MTKCLNEAENCYLYDSCKLSINFYHYHSEDLVVKNKFNESRLSLVIPSDGVKSLRSLSYDIKNSRHSLSGRKFEITTLIVELSKAFYHLQKTLCVRNL